MVIKKTSSGAGDSVAFWRGNRVVSGKGSSNRKSDKSLGSGGEEEDCV